MWNCPACHAPLALELSLNQHQRQWQCETGHSYDVAKEGYVNLMLANQKNSKEPGDNKAMINARRAFLDQGYYQPLAEQLAQLIEQYCPTETLNIYDAGCGEGYYLNHIQQVLLQTKTADRTIVAQGSDIAKVAVQKAAKKYPQSQFAVASSFHLPIGSRSIDALIQVFAPLSEIEVYRALKNGGIWLSVNPAAEHLWQLKQALYDTPQPFVVEEVKAEGLTPCYQQTLQFAIHIDDPQQRQHLLAMTPYYWSTPKEKLPQVLAAMANLTIAFDIQVQIKQGQTDA
ncbi:rRNA (guanine-N1)-methyltransferase [Alteromonadaceae bacterium BrNp21-10]|nr:rRNA (guanine-N1)-methyltransferase [Alteromonadaceae bacterium BrNp21-10]